MSSPADSLIARAPVFDRRFYPRTAPSSLTHVIIGPEISGELINLGENGFRLAAPFELSNNFVCRATLPLNGVERPIEVCVRVVWTGEAKQTGFQFMDLREKDREQIRKWAAMQAKTAPPAESTEILSDAGLEAEPMAEPEAAPMQAVSAAQPAKRKNRSGIAIALVAACVVTLTATGFAVWASPIGSWVARTFAAETKSVFAMPSKRGNPERASNSTSPHTSVAESAVATDAATSKNLALQPAAVTTAGVAAANEIGGQKGATQTAALNSAAGKKYAPSKKPIEQANAIPVAARSDGALNSDSAAAIKSGDDNGGGVATGSGYEKIDTKPLTGLAGANPARASVTSEAATLRGANTDFRPTRPAAPAAAIPATASAEPEIIQTPAPTSRVVDVMLPNSPRPTAVSMPGERVFQSSALTLRIQRAIVAPAGYARWSAERKKKVLLGDLLSRVDPRAPRTADAASSRVSVRAMIGKDGRVEKLAPVNGSAELVPRVMRAVREWRFQPTMLDGKPLETTALVTIEFRGQATATATR